MNPPTMRLISSRSTFFSKYVFTVIWFGFLAFTMVECSGILPGTKLVPLAIIAQLFMAVVGFFVLKHFAFNLADKVWDDGDTLVVRKGAREERIPLANIMNVGYANSRPNLVTFTLREPCIFGSEVSFIPPARMLSFFSTHPIVTDLIHRIDEKRRR